MDSLVINLVVGVICGAIAAAIASSKGRSVVGWFFGGFFIGIIGIIIVACLSNKKEETARLAFAERERHRLREQLRQEQLRVESLRRHTAERLDAHDQALGLDTRTVSSLPGGEGFPQALSYEPAPMALGGGDNGAIQQVPGQAAPSGASGRPQQQTPSWFFEVHGKQRGPVPEVEIHELIRGGTINARTLLWREGLADWTPLASMPQFAYATRGQD
jgi:uncharacterized membrane protein YeaQ/YmgE (transglycosylase-associated protein family)